MHDNLLAVFDHVQGHEGAWTARCPAHEDARNSLSIGIGAAGWLLRCHAGCETDAILGSAHLTVADLMRGEKTTSDGAIACYTYRAATGEPVMQVRRYLPKDFRQFRYEAGTWVPKLLQTTPRVLYRLPELHGQVSVWLTEGEKDADKLLAAGLAATTKAGGASSWLPDYTKQLQAAGVKTVYLLPDNDEPGRKYMRQVERALTLAGLTATTITLPDVPDKGDVSDWLKTHTIDQLRALAEPKGTAPMWTPRTFEPCGFNAYRLSLPHQIITLELSRLRRQSHELIGELVVRCTLPGAQTVDGILSSGDFNLSSVQARSTRAKHLASRAKLEEADWEGWLHELVLKVLQAERQGAPPVLLADVPVPENEPGDFEIHGLSLPRCHPAILFGDGGAAKSLFALDVAAQLSRAGELVMYCDWEADASDHARRVRQMGTLDAPILYVRCDRPLVHEVDRLRTITVEHGITYTIMDSAAYGCQGAPESAESALDYFRALRSLGSIGHFIIAHVTKSDDGDKRPFGSSFWHNSARATWHVRRSNPDDDSDEISTLVTPRKANFGRLKPPSAYNITFGERVTIKRASVAQREEFTPFISFAQRLYAALRTRPLTREDMISEFPDTKPDTIQRSVRRGLEKGSLISFQHTDGKEVIRLAK